MQLDLVALKKAFPDPDDLKKFLALIESIDLQDLNVELLTEEGMVAQAGSPAVAYFNPQASAIQLNKSYWRDDLAKLQNYLSGAVQNGYHPYGANPAYVLQHEMAHYAHPVDPTGNLLHGKSAAHVKSYIDKVGGLDGVATQLSKYATTSEGELVADLYAMAQQGMALPKEAQQLAKQLGIPIKGQSKAPFGPLEYRELIQSQRKQQLQIGIQTSQRIENALQATISSLEQKLRKIPADKEVSLEPFYKNLLKESKEVLANFREDYADILQAGMLGSAQNAADRERQLAFRLGKPIDEGLARTMQRTYTTGQGKISVQFGKTSLDSLHAAATRIYGSSGLVLSDRIWQVHAKAKRGIEDTIFQAIQEQISVQELQKRLHSSLLDKGHDNASYRAHRLARTEITTIHREAHIRSVKELKTGLQKDWVQGVGWRLSQSHNRPDICDVWASHDAGRGPGVYDADEVPNDHPNGLCYTVTVIKDFPETLTPSQVPQPDQVDAREIKRWALKTKDPAAKAWYKDWLKGSASGAALKLEGSLEGKITDLLMSKPLGTKMAVGDLYKELQASGAITGKYENYEYFKSAFRDTIKAGESKFHLPEKGMVSLKPGVVKPITQIPLKSLSFNDAVVKVLNEQPKIAQTTLPSPADLKSIFNRMASEGHPFIDQTKPIAPQYEKFKNQIRANAKKGDVGYGLAGKGMLTLTGSPVTPSQVTTLPVINAPKPPPAVNSISHRPEDFPSDVTKLVVVKKLGGSTGAELVKDEKGNLFVRKHGAAPIQADIGFKEEIVTSTTTETIKRVRLHKTPGENKFWYNHPGTGEVVLLQTHVDLTLAGTVIDEADPTNTTGAFQLAFHKPFEKTIQKEETVQSSLGKKTLYHIREEAAADAVYRRLGVPVPDFKLYETPNGPVKLAKFVEGKTLSEYMREASTAKKAEVIKQLHDHFAVDAFVGNWDVIGLAEDNVLVGDDGKVWRIDNGGSFRFRAQGALKTGDQWNEHISDVWTLRDGNLNAQTSKYFSQVDLRDLGRQMRFVSSNIQDLEQLVDPEVFTALRGRASQFSSIGNKIEDMKADNWKDHYVDKLTKHMTGLRKAGFDALLPKMMIQKHEAGHFYDENDRFMDHMRDQLTQLTSKYMQDQSTDWNHIEAWATTQAGSSASRTSMEFKKWLAHQQDAELNSFFWHGGIDTTDRLEDLNNPQQDAYTVMHAMSQLMLEKVDFKQNNIAARTTKLIRTESSQVLKKYGVRSIGDVATWKHAVFESTSIHHPVYIGGDTKTETNVPHHRVLAPYWFSRTDKYENTMFMGDGENEFIAMLNGLEAKVTSSKDYQLKAGATKPVAKVTPPTPSIKPPPPYLPGPDEQWFWLNSDQKWHLIPK